MVFNYFPAERFDLARPQSLSPGFTKAQGETRDPIEQAAYRLYTAHIHKPLGKPCPKGAGYTIAESLVPCAVRCSVQCGPIVRKTLKTFRFKRCQTPDAVV
jgi:hypothetical protein